MDCVYYAYEQAASVYGVKLSGVDLALFHALKMWAQGTAAEYTEHAVVPYVLRKLSKFRGLSMLVLHAPFMAEFVSGQRVLENPRIRRFWEAELPYSINGFSGYTDDTYAKVLPAVVCNYLTQHATFENVDLRNPPKGTGMIAYFWK